MPRGERGTNSNLGLEILIWTRLRIFNVVELVFLVKKSKYFHASTLIVCVNTSLSHRQRYASLITIPRILMTGEGTGGDGEGRGALSSAKLSRWLAGLVGTLPMRLKCSKPSGSSGTGCGPRSFQTLKVRWRSSPSRARRTPDGACTAKVQFSKQTSVYSLLHPIV